MDNTLKMKSSQLISSWSKVSQCLPIYYFSYNDLVQKRVLLILVNETSRFCTDGRRVQIQKDRQVFLIHFQHGRGIIIIICYNRKNSNKIRESNSWLVSEMRRLVQIILNVEANHWLTKSQLILIYFTSAKTDWHCFCKNSSPASFSPFVIPPRIPPLPR